MEEDFKVGDWISVKDNVWWKGMNISGRRGIITNTDSYILVDIFNLPDYMIPVKLFRYEIEIDKWSETSIAEESEWGDDE